MRVAVIDVGSYTVRLLVAAGEGSGIESVHEQRAALALGADIEKLGYISPVKFDETLARVRAYARNARRHKAQCLEVIVTAPGRQSADSARLVAALGRASGAPVRVLPPDDEGRLAFDGAVACTDVAAESIAVCDVGGGSTEIVVGTRKGGPAWVRSIELGAVRLTGRVLKRDPPGKRSLAAARATVDEHLDGLTPPLPQAALATGGTARALSKIVGPSLGATELAEALELLAGRPSAKVAKSFDIERGRARTLPAGALILAAIHERLGVSLEVARTGLREGAALALLADLAA
jgi:exopolyphosphatase/guanosine-5'-triphosphate,3'-diphosphate pyrophosphatase